MVGARACWRALRSGRSTRCSMCARVIRAAALANAKRAVTTPPASPACALTSVSRCAGRSCTTSLGKQAPAPPRSAFKQSALSVPLALGSCCWLLAVQRVFSYWSRLTARIQTRLLSPADAVPTASLRSPAAAAPRSASDLQACAPASARCKTALTLLQQSRASGPTNGPSAPRARASHSQPPQPRSPRATARPPASRTWRRLQRRIPPWPAAASA